MSTRQDGGIFEEARTRSIIGAFYQDYTELGFGVREYIYALAIERELVTRGHKVEREVPAMVHYLGQPLASQTLDMIVDRRLIL